MKRIGMVLLLGFVAALNFAAYASQGRPLSLGLAVFLCFVAALWLSEKD